MQILYAIAIAAVIGVIVRYIVPGQRSYGIALAPGAAAAVTAAVWGVLVWFGWDWTVGWIWVISLGASLIAVILIAVISPGARKRSDTAFLERAKRA
ncbi:MAG TPA: hypothetical protein VNQ52_00195 [Microbacteriaceae bacterium]|nr:hypothetical protein [Microbacteriaceae bacterium]